VNLYEYRTRQPQWELVEWPEPIEVQESRDPEEVERVRKAWKERVGDPDVRQVARST
jgi:hypothetical protein